MRHAALKTIIMEFSFQVGYLITQLISFLSQPIKLLLVDVVVVIVFVVVVVVVVIVVVVGFCVLLLFMLILLLMFLSLWLVPET